MLLRKVSYIFMLCALVGLHDARGARGSKGPLSTLQNSSEVSAEILSLVGTYFTARTLNQTDQSSPAGQKIPHMSPETKKFILETGASIAPILNDADTLFSSTPGYADLKEKILGFVEKLCVQYGYKQTEIATLTQQLDTIKKDITNAQQEPLEKKLEKQQEALKKLEQQIHDLTEKSKAQTNQKLCEKNEQQQKEINKKITAKKAIIQQISQGILPTDDYISSLTFTGNDNSTTAYQEFLDLKKQYLEILRSIDELSPDRAQSLELPHWGLTCSAAYAEKLRYSQEQFVKATKKEHEKWAKRVYTASLQRLSQVDSARAALFQETAWGTVHVTPAEKKKSTCDDLAIGLRGALYELKAALMAVEHHETVLAFGVQLTLTFDKQKNPSAINTIEQHPDYLHPATPKNAPEKVILSQEFDLVTNQHIIECKCIDYDLSDYIQNFLREQFMANNIAKATQATVTIVTENYDQLKPAISNKTVICYVDYAQSEYGQKHAAAEARVLENGFTVWDGICYCHTISDTFTDFEALKQHIQDIGPKKFILHCIVKTNTAIEPVRAALTHAGITKISTNMQSPDGLAKKMLHHHTKKRKVDDNDTATPDQEHRTIDTVSIKSICFTIKEPTMSPMSKAINRLRFESPQKTMDQHSSAPAPVSSAMVETASATREAIDRKQKTSAHEKILLERKPIKAVRFRLPPMAEEPTSSSAPSHETVDHTIPQNDPAEEPMQIEESYPIHQ